MSAWWAAFHWARRRTGGRATTACGKACRRQAEDGAPFSLKFSTSCMGVAALVTLRYCTVLTLLAGWHASGWPSTSHHGFTGHDLAGRRVEGQRAFV